MLRRDRILAIERRGYKLLLQKKGVASIYGAKLVMNDVESARITFL